MARVEDVRYEGGLPPTLIDDAIHGLGLYRANMTRGAARRRVPRTVTVPVQLVVPEHDPFVSRAMFDGIEQWVPELTRTDVVGGHWIVRRDPELVAQIVSTHLDRVGA